MRVTGWIPGGTTSLVARATRQDGVPVVLKLAVPGSWLDEQARTLGAAAGDGYVRLLAHDPARHAVLLEALGPSLRNSGLPVEAQLSVLGRLVRRGWRPPPQGEPPRDKAAELAELVQQLWDELGRPCSEQVVAQALTCARRRSAAFDPQGAVLLHGDAATANAARVLGPRDGTVDGFVLLDPDSFVGDPAYDAGVAARDGCELLEADPAPARLLDGWCRLLAAETGTDPAAVADWAYLERVSTGLWALSLTPDEAALAHLRTAQRVLDDGGPTPS